MIAFVIITIGAVTCLFILDFINTGRVLRESHKRIMDRIGTAFDGVKTFLTVTFIDKFFSAIEPDVNDDVDDLDDTNPES